MPEFNIRCNVTISGVGKHKAVNMLIEAPDMESAIQKARTSAVILEIERCDLVMAAEVPKPAPVNG